MKSAQRRTSEQAPVTQSKTANEVVPEQRGCAPVLPAEAPPSNGRGLPSSVLTPPPPSPAAHLDDYESVIGQGEVDALRFLAHERKGKTLKMVNSTAVGGGVAEMLNRIVPLLSELEVPAQWDVITGGNDFFEVTKAFHNALQGTPYQLTKHAQEIFLMYNEQNLQRMQFDEELVVIHDPQPAALIQARDNSSAKWGWRCHIDLSNPNAGVWDFLRPFVEQFDAAIFSSQSFTRQLPIPQYLYLSLYRSAFGKKQASRRLRGAEGV